MSLVSVSISAPSTAEMGQAFNVEGAVFGGPAPLGLMGLGPIAGATVTIYQNGTSKGTTTTSGSGFYSKSISINKVGTFALRANALGVWSNTDYITITAPPEPPYVNSVSINAPYSADENESFTITGRVVDQFGAAMAGVTVHLYRNGTSIGSAITNSIGYYSMNYSIPSAGVYTLQAIADSRSDSTTITITEAPGEPYTVIDGFVVPDSLPAGSDVNVSVLLRNTGGASGYLSYGINGNPTSPDRYMTVEAGSTYPIKVAPGGSMWLDVYFRYFKMPGWDFNLTATNEDGTSTISKTITLSVPIGIPTTTTISAPSKAAVDEKFSISGILYETESGIPIPYQPINHSYDGRSLGSSITGVDGDYLKEVSVPEAGVWTLKSEFPGTEALQTSRALVDAVVAATPIETALLIAGPIAGGLALFIYGLS